MPTTDDIHALEIQKSVFHDVVSYMRDCRFPAHLITPRVVCLALEASYKPQRVFWRALTRETILLAIECYAPDFASSLSFVDENPYEILVDRIDFMLDLRSRDELNAEILLSAPDSKRQFASESPFEYLVCELIARREFELADILIAERELGPDAALELAEAQLAVKEGRSFMTKHMQEATITRDAFMVARPFDEDEFDEDEDEDEDEDY